MSIPAHLFKEAVIVPTLIELGVNSAAACNLLLGTAIQESGLGFSIPICHRGHGMYQISSQVHQDVWDNYLSYDPDLASCVRGLASQRHFLTDPHRELTTNLSYATAIAWYTYIHYGLPPSLSDSIDELAENWAKYFPSQSVASSSCFVKNFKHHTESVVAA